MPQEQRPTEKFRTSVGGQALMEGIMMVGPKRTVAAFCDEEGNISTEEISVPRLRHWPMPSRA